MSATISYRAGWWFVSIAVEVEHETPRHSGGTVGIDPGIKILATLSDGKKFENQRHYRRNLERIQGLSKGLSRKVEGSQNWWKNAKKLAKAHYRDLNAAIMVETEALRLRTDVPVVASSGRKFACGAGSSGSDDECNFLL
jgi:transposase